MSRLRMTPAIAHILHSVRPQIGAKIKRRFRNDRGQIDVHYVLWFPDGTEEHIHGRTVEALKKWVRLQFEVSEVRALLDSKILKDVRRFRLDQQTRGFIPAEDLDLDHSVTPPRSMPKLRYSNGDLTRAGVRVVLAGEGNPPISERTVAKYIRLGMPQISKGRYNEYAVYAWFIKYLHDKAEAAGLLEAVSEIGEIWADVPFGLFEPEIQSEMKSVALEVAGQHGLFISDNLRQVEADMAKGPQVLAITAKIMDRLKSGADQVDPTTLEAFIKRTLAFGQAEQELDAKAKVKS